MISVEHMNMETLTFRKKKINPSSTRSSEEKDMARYLSEQMHNEEMYKQASLQRVNFDVEIKNNKVYVKCIYLIHENGEVSSHNVNHLVDLDERKEKKLPQTLRKVGAFMMPVGSPSFVGMYAEEVRDTVSKPTYKVIFSIVLTAIVGFLGIKLASLVLGLLIIAVLDTILGLIPGNVKQGSEKDHTIQAKFMALTTNFIGIIAITKGMEYLIAFSEAKFISEFVLPYLPYLVASWAFSTYFYRIVRYMALANRTKLPKMLTDRFDRSENG